MNLYMKMMKDNDDYKLLSKKERQEYDEQVKEIAESMITIFESGFELGEEDNEEMDE